MPGDLASRALYYSVFGPSFALATAGFSLRMFGRANVPRSGPAVLVANHQSFLDPWLVGQSAPRRLRYLARDSLFRLGPFGQLIRGFGAVPIDRGFGKEGLRAVLDLLAQGEAVLVFAEGERTATGELQPLRPGVGLLISRAKCPVVPVGIAGAYAVWPRHRSLPAPRPVWAPAGRGIGVAFGRAVAPESFGGLGRDAVLARLGAELSGAVSAAGGV